MSEKIIAVQSVRYVVRKIQPPYLVISATGVTGTSGWKNPQLIFKGLTNDVLEYDFVAEAPDSRQSQLLTPIAASIEYHGDLNVIRAIRVNSGTHSIERSFGFDAEESIENGHSGSCDLAGYKLRVLRPGDVGDAHYDPRRATISVDDNQVITDVRIG